MDTATILVAITVIFSAGGTYFKVWDTSRRLEKHMDEETARDIRRDERDEQRDRQVLSIALKVGATIEE
tara:strand:+ start:181 stop:387 length:207 start_codon:yes stop_codon:yes gene_type:complete